MPIDPEQQRRHNLRIFADRGRKVPCPYCEGKGHNDQANAECGFCDNGTHTYGE